MTLKNKVDRGKSILIEIYSSLDGDKAVTLYYVKKGGG